MGDRVLDGRLVALGQRIRDIRTARGLTQQELADRSGIGRTSIANIEAGRQGSIGVLLLFDMATALRVEPALLLDSAVDVVALTAAIRNRLVGYMRGALEEFAATAGRSGGTDGG